MISPEERLVLRKLYNQGWVRETTFDEDEADFLVDLEEAAMVRVRSDYVITEKGMRELDGP